ncbi:hypothetical protein LTR10_021568 [Elasticomyces elasticus]|uniref:DUF7923 domain-containing protein n=1 Tax=Exophiala sideris TaxID=1016849 RepID=A0ABR0JJA2_9EURO|nr:hypothetical protein LTR10_021568 [Elasticomyces elasticus]KAK5035145.1 hypothetical protein LTS07_002581 [Exophiala sideris]KAK5039503.1 hypothetical protein LTR13_003760 [Exophiala sideris]KAK5066069.1 hypothetical protein LTR69_002587 [Exophiala sideris]KAK5186745.1 hypothetical protein LTR44_000751 [Eurotiomycetes sp. CCFEE 6388]
MADTDTQVSLDSKSLAREHEDYKQKTVDQHAFVEKLLKLFAEKEQACEDLKSDLDDQTESRRRWQKRAVDVESRITSVQHLLVLIDGNQSFFKSNFIRAGTIGLREAATAFIAEVKEFAKAQHKNDLPEDISLVVHIFSDIGGLAQDLSASDSLPDPDQLWTFIQDICKLEPCFTVSDCGSGHEAVDAKLKYYYELFIENCHCRHVFLALGQQSEYYKILQLYSDDDYTRGKTSLVQPSHGFAPGVDIPFHTVEFSSLDSVPSSSGALTQINETPRGERAAEAWSQGHRIQALSANMPSSTSFGNHSPRSTYPTSDALLVNANIEAPTEAPDPQPMSTPKLERGANSYAEINGTTKDGDDADGAGVVKLESSAHSSSQSNKAAEQSWETNVSQNSYAPPPIQGAWGEEASHSATVHDDHGDDQPYSRDRRGFAKPRGDSRRGTNASNKRNQNLAWKQDRSNPNSSFSRPAGRAPRQFEGSWDDIVERKPSRRQSQVSSMRATPEPPTSPKSNGISAAAFTRQVASMPEPNPGQRPICSPIALNKLDQRIDLKLPRPSPDDQELFDLRSRIVVDMTALEVTIVPMCLIRQPAADPIVPSRRKGCMKSQIWRLSE